MIVVDTCLVLRIVGAPVIGKKLIVNGVGFDDGAKILLNDQQQKMPITTRILIAKKAGKLIAWGQTIMLQVRNLNGSLSPEFSFTRTQ